MMNAEKHSGGYPKKYWTMLIATLSGFLFPLAFIRKVDLENNYDHAVPPCHFSFWVWISACHTQSHETHKVFAKVT